VVFVCGDVYYELLVAVLCTLIGLVKLTVDSYHRVFPYLVISFFVFLFIVLF